MSHDVETFPNFPVSQRFPSAAEVRAEDREGDAEILPTIQEMIDLLLSQGKGKVTIDATIAAMIEAGLLQEPGTSSSSTQIVFGDPNNTGITFGGGEQQQQNPQFDIVPGKLPGTSEQSQPSQDDPEKISDEEIILEKKTAAEAEEEEGNLRILANILFGKGALFTIPTLTALFTNGLTRILLDRVFGTEAERALDFMNTLFPDTNAWERLRGNTGIAGFAGQDVNERMQIRQLEVQKQMNRAVVSATIETAYIRNIPQMELIPSQKLMYAQDAYLSKMRGITEGHHGIIQGINAIYSHDKNAAQIKAIQYGHFQGMTRLLKDLEKELKSTESKGVQAKIGTWIFTKEQEGRQAISNFKFDVGEYFGIENWQVLEPGTRQRIVDMFKEYATSGIFGDYSQDAGLNNIDDELRLNLLRTDQ